MPGERLAQRTADPGSTGIPVPMMPTANTTKVSGPGHRP
jgi:hypothetical protein